MCLLYMRFGYKIRPRTFCILHGQLFQYLTFGPVRLLDILNRKHFYWTEISNMIQCQKKHNIYIYIYVQMSFIHIKLINGF